MDKRFALRHIQQNKPVGIFGTVVFNDYGPADPVNF